MKKEEFIRRYGKAAWKKEMARKNMKSAIWMKKCCKENLDLSRKESYKLETK